jgi:hypothetical protein
MKTTQTPSDRSDASSRTWDPLIASAASFLATEAVVIVLWYLFWPRYVAPGQPAVSVAALKQWSSDFASAVSFALYIFLPVALLTLVGTAISSGTRSKSSD